MCLYHACGHTAVTHGAAGDAVPGMWPVLQAVVLWKLLGRVSDLGCGWRRRWARGTRCGRPMAMQTPPVQHPGYSAPRAIPHVKELASNTTRATPDLLYRST
eukprot:355514-Chlamydomonas_euryale.AAC.1